MSGVATAVAVVGIGSAVMSNMEANKAEGKVRDTANAGLLFDTMRYDKATAANQPYADVGATALGQAANYDLMQGVGEVPSYDKEFMDKLGDYKQSAGYEAQNALGQQALQRQLNARGLNYGATGATAGAELSQKLTANDFGEWRKDLNNRYGALKGEYDIRRQNNQNRYSQLKDMIGIGERAQGRQAALDASMSSQSHQGLNTLAGSAQQEGKNNAQMYTSIGSSLTGAISGGGGAGGLGSMFSGAGGGAAAA